MQFTSREMKFIEKLRKDERRWPRMRWLGLAIAILSTINLGLFSYRLYILVKEDRDHLGSAEVCMLLFIWTTCVMYFVFTVWFSILVITRWHGDMNRMLLLKLLDARQKEAGGDERSSPSAGT